MIPTPRPPYVPRVGRFSAYEVARAYPDIAVVNEAYPGDRVLTNGGMGTNALSQFDISVLSHARVATVVMMMGINDIGWPGDGAITPSDPEPTAEDVVAGYKQIIDRAHAHGIRFVAVTLTPFIDTFKGTPLIARAAAMKPGGQPCPAFPCNGPPAIGVAGIAIFHTKLRPLRHPPSSFHRSEPSANRCRAERLSPRQQPWPRTFATDCRRP